MKRSTTACATAEHRAPDLPVPYQQQVQDGGAVAVPHEACAVSGT